MFRRLFIFLLSGHAPSSRRQGSLHRSTNTPRYALNRCQHRCYCVPVSPNSFGALSETDLPSTKRGYSKKATTANRSLFPRGLLFSSRFPNNCCSLCDTDRGISVRCAVLWNVPFHPKDAVQGDSVEDEIFPRAF